MRTCSRKRIIVYRKYVMFIKQSPTRFTMVTKNDTKTGHFLDLYLQTNHPKLFFNFILQ